MYNIVISILLIMLIPPRLRKGLMISFLNTISVPLQYIVDSLAAFRMQKSYEMALNSQIIYLEKMLNKTFNPYGTFDDIYITDNLLTDEKIYMGQPDEEDSIVYFGHVWIPGVSTANDADEFLFDGLTWVSLIDDNSTDPVEGETWAVVADDEMIYLGYMDEFMGSLSFTVHLSSSLYTQIVTRMPEMSSYINKYKLLGIKYKYEII